MFEECKHLINTLVKNSSILSPFLHTCQETENLMISNVKRHWKSGHHF